MSKLLGTMRLVDLTCSPHIRSLTVSNLSHNQYLHLLLYSTGSGMFSDVTFRLR